MSLPPRFAASSPGPRAAALLGGLVIALTGAPALADEDATRFRGGVQSEVGPAFFVGTADGAAVAGLTGHVGLQLGETFGVYLAPQIQGFMGEKRGPHVGIGLVADVTLADLVSLGLGPTIGGGELEDGPGAEGGMTLGGLAHVAFYPEVPSGADGRRTGLTLGLDLHARLVPHFDPQCLGCVEVEPPLVIVPAVFVGYEAF